MRPHRCRAWTVQFASVQPT